MGDRVRSIAPPRSATVAAVDAKQQVRERIWRVLEDDDWPVVPSEIGNPQPGPA
jgi:hypothetical protein